MLKKICNTCYNYTKCNFCITYGNKIGKTIYLNTNFCNTCKKIGKCEFCKKFGNQSGKYYYKTYIEYIKDCNKR